MTTHAAPDAGLSPQELARRALPPEVLPSEQQSHEPLNPGSLTPESLTPELLRAWAWHKQGLDGSLLGADAADVFTTAGWARSVGGANPI